MKRFIKALTMLLILTVLCPGVLAEEEVFSDACEPQVEEIEMGLDEMETESAEEALPPSETETPDAPLHDSEDPSDVMISEAEEPAPEAEAANVLEDIRTTSEADAQGQAQSTDEDAPLESPVPEASDVPESGNVVITPKAAASQTLQPPQAFCLGRRESRRLPGFDAVKVVSFTSSRPKVVSVSADGTVTGKKKGKASITAQTSDGKRYTIKVTVMAAPKKIRLNIKKLVLETGSASTLHVLFRKRQTGAVQFSSSNPRVAQVNGAGRVTAIGQGSAEIIARTYNGKTAKCRVTVVAPAAQVNMTNEFHVALSGKKPFGYSVRDANNAAYAGQVSVTLSPRGIAVYKKGKIIGKKVGTATLTLRAGKLSKTCKVVVELVGNAGRIPVLAYHRVVSDETKASGAFVNDRFTISLSTFTQQMNWLRDQHYTAITCDQLYSWHNRRINLPARSVLITFDDGYASTIENVIPVLEATGLRGTAFIIGSLSHAGNDPAFITAGRIRQIQASHPCLAFQSHSWGLHRRDAYKTETYEAFIADAAIQERIYGFKYIAYPYGKKSKAMIRAYRDSGLRMAFLFGDSTNGYATRQQNRFKIKRIEVKSDMSLEAFKEWCP